MAETSATSVRPPRVRVRRLDLASGRRWPELVMFDLDGTLIDSVPDLAAATNRLLATEGHDPLAVGEVRSMIGNGVGKLVERAFARRAVRLEGQGLSAMTDRMMGIYGDRLTVDTTLMDGAGQALEENRLKGIRNAVVTNKPERFARSILDHFGLADMIDVVVGGDSGPPRKPAPDMLLHVLRVSGVDASHALMVGDGPADIDAARAAGVQSIALRGGYTTVAADALGADLVIDGLGDLATAMETLAPAIRQA